MVLIHKESQTTATVIAKDKVGEVLYMTDDYGKFLMS